MRKFFRNNGLSLVMFGLFLLFLAGQAVVGWQENNSQREEHKREPLTLLQYAGSAHFAEAVFENWESEFLQMAGYVMLTGFLFQKGSAESKDPDETEEEKQRKAEKAEERRRDPNAPWPVRRGGLVLKLYEHSLSLSLFLFFALSFAAHGIGGARAYNEEQAMHGAEPVSVPEFMSTSEFWFQSLQNWQSEFLAVGVLCVLSIWLREKDSPESKPVEARHDETIAN